jgi:uncharacterized protein YegL
VPPANRVVAWRSPSTRARCVFFALGLAIGCTNADLQEAPAQPRSADDKISLSGQFCTGVPDPAEFPVRILFVVDISGSMAVSDPEPPNGLSRRAQAIVDIMKKYPPGTGLAYGLISFASDASILTTGANGLSGFTSDANQVIKAVPSLSAVNGQTSYDSALSLAYQMLQADMNDLDATARSRARYEIVFISDGAPDPDTTGPGESLPPDVRRDVLDIAGLQSTQQLASVSLNTVYLTVPGTPDSELFQASTLLSTMANLANGTYRQFDSNQSINLFYIDFTSLVRTFTLKTFVVSNVNERAVPGPGGAGSQPGVDSDGDGLDDATEVLIGTSPLLADTDGDGFSDGLEYRLRNSGFNPLYPDDADCSQVTDREDTDGDGLLNCEERYLGTSLQLMDTDADGYSDDVEVRNGTNPVIADGLGDLDFDGAPNGFELADHTDPLRDDAADFSQIAYRYSVVSDEDAGSPGQACYHFVVDNVTLAPSLSAVPGAAQGGTNTVLLHVTSTVSDNPDDPGSHLIACVRPRYRESPEGKDPSSGQMVVPAEAFKTPGLSPDGGVGFDENRDCIVPAP